MQFFRGLYLVVAKSHVAGSAELEHAGTEGLELGDGEAEGVDAVFKLLSAVQDPDDYCRVKTEAMS